MTTIHHAKKGAKNRMNKRGEDVLIDFWAILTFVFIVVVFFILFKVTANEATAHVSEDFEGKDIAFMTHAFIRAPLRDNPDTTIGMFIGKELADDQYSEQTERYFQEFFRGIKTYQGQDIQSIKLCIFNKDNGFEDGANYEPRSDSLSGEYNFCNFLGATSTIHYKTRIATPNGYGYVQMEIVLAPTMDESTAAMMALR